MSLKYRLVECLGHRTCAISTLVDDVKCFSKWLSCVVFSLLLQCQLRWLAHDRKINNATGRKAWREAEKGEKRRKQKNERIYNTSQYYHQGN